MLVVFARYGRDNSFQALRANRPFVVVMTVGSIAGTPLGGLLPGSSPPLVLIPLLVGLFLLSAVKVWRHTRRERMW